MQYSDEDKRSYPSMLITRNKCTMPAINEESLQDRGTSTVA